MKTTYSLLFILLLFQCSYVNSQTKNSKENPSDKVDALIAKYNFKNGPGFSVAVIKNGAIVYKKGFGIANLEYGTPITPTTVFQIASVSKQFTAFAILLLEQEGKLSLEDDIRKYLPEMVDYGHKITLRNLANHTSGIRDNTALANLIGTNEADLLSNEQAVKLITSQKGLNFIPGEEYEYCNSGYILLAEIVKRISGQSFADFAKAKIFNPLKMKNSQVVDDPETIIKNRAYSYHKYNNIYCKSILNHSFVGSTNLNTTTEDLCLWTMNFEKKNIGNDAIFNKMKEKGKLNNGELIPYGLGIENRTYKGLNVLFHGGGDADYGSYILRIPEHNFSVVFLCNSHLFHPLDFVYNIVDFYLNDKETKTNSKPIFDQNLLKSFVGDYEVFPGYIVSISKENDTLFHLAKGDTISNRVKLIQTGDYEFTYPNLPHSKFVFNKTNGQITEFLKWHISDFSYKGKRIEIKEFDTEKINLNELVGLYYNAELNTTYKFIIKENNLIATHSRNSDAIFTAFQPDLFVSNLGEIEVIRNEQNKVIGFYLMTQGIRKIKFEKMNDK
ncbi:serine hydrolase domain-containing protein [Flavobacterium paronense]|uniref:Serine hydrolase domain-containing protein n=1 Tax=Flavobacterium paronense TaxID=1392775 RepID=A0ABV5GHI5_9FLAO|nr:serine hydrolase domain-containing protein [Flavobacterium paronense]MDN3676426.1 serine hydrolase domain-containing protein [Flavobacterium paronense]